MASEFKVDLAFQVIGRQVPVDHGYALYAAICRILPQFHEDRLAGLSLLRGRYVGGGLLDLLPKTCLIIRLPVSHISHYLTLAGKKLDILGCNLRIGVPSTRALVPSVTLYSHLVTTKNGNDPLRFNEEIKRQAEKLGMKGKLVIGDRRTISVHDKQIVGYSVLASGLAADESILLQESGLGGRRKMGCGFFEAID